ncbi:MAG: hypothetical protein AAGF68_00550 [Pseudomonadota bacterium]
MSERYFDGPSVFHLGYIKSATTYLQNEIFAPEHFGCALAAGADNRAHLVDWFITSDGFAFDGAAVDAQITALEDPLRRRGLVPIWSEETLLGDPTKRQYNGPDTLQRIAALKRPTKVILSIREQRAMALSIFREFIKQGGSHSLRQLIGTGAEARSFTPILRPDFLMFDRAAAWCTDRFGAENVLLLPLEALTADRAAYFERLFGFLGLPPQEVTAQQAANVGLGARAQGLRRMLNRLDVRDPLTAQPSLYRRGVGRLTRLVDRTVPKAAHRSVESAWRAQIDTRYADMFHDSNQRLQQIAQLDLSKYGYQ